MVATPKAKKARPEEGAVSRGPDPAQMSLTLKSALDSAAKEC